jgi:NTE family protein
MHRIDGGEILEGFHASTKSATDAKLIHTLRDLGRDCARLWLAKRFASLGVASSVNIARDYLDDLRVPSR